VLAQRFGTLGEQPDDLIKALARLLKGGQLVAEIIAIAPLGERMREGEQAGLELIAALIEGDGGSALDVFGVIMDGGAVLEPFLGR
jgi:hypothetical protein